MGEGFITLHRSVQKHWIWQEPEALKFWMALLMQANWEPKTTVFNKRLITVERGQVVFGRKVWSERLKISEMKLRRYLEMLKAQGMINQQITSRYSLITVLNYHEYQVNNQQTTSKQPASNQQVTTSKQVNNKTIGKKFVPPTVLQVKEYCEERKNTVDPETFIDFYSASNWMRGRNKVKDWKACIRTWEKNRRDTSYSSPANLSSQEYFL
jgi:hypothetical protein|tara:strand:+ start:3607 stop:4239 length:633 start_codon:yes stop_codon:yes gene_type:complete